MALPKRRHSRARGRKRRTNDKVAKPQASACPSCGEPKLPHRMCPHCGTYKGREIVAADKEKKESVKTAKKKSPLGWKR
ncbi:MAG: 50S ribosomal protein L32 [Candidatus Eisenbacteria bacterium]|nr:50S ribosomal protein L32 [Candidatus Eisenbacteria bacterium]